MEPRTLRDKVGAAVTSGPFQTFIMIVVMLNAASLGVETMKGLSPETQMFLVRIDGLFLLIYCIEICLKLYAFGLRFFRDPWNVFDFVIVAVALMPNSGPFAVLRTLRVLRAFRLISVVPSFRRVVEGLVRAVPGLGAVLGVMVVMFYIGGVMFTTLYGETFPEYFGNIGASMMTLFQLMLFDGWGDIVREVSAAHRFAWAILLIHTVIAGFAAFNLIVAVMVDGLVEEQTEAAEATRATLQAGQAETQREIDVIEERLAAMDSKIDRLLAGLEKRP